MNKQFDFLKRIRTYFLIMFLSIISVSAATYSQEVVSLKLKNTTIKDAFSEIEKNSEYRFLFTGDMGNSLDKRIDINIDSKEISETLDAIIKGNSLGYNLIDKQVVIFVKEESKQPAKTTTTKVTQQPAMYVVKGRVFDDLGDPLPGVSIYLKSNKAMGVSSDIDGYFTIPVRNKEDVLIFSFVGMLNKEVKVSAGNQKDLKVEMQTDDVMLGEVVITGYQVLSKERATGAYDIVGTDKIEKRIFTNAAEALEGQAAGLSTFKGDVVVRGISTFSSAIGSEPLLVIDGMPTERKLDNINMNDIETITLLKDAAATSIYGVRAANGVIVITTKGGALTGETKTSVQFTSDLRWVTNPRLKDYHYATTSDYMDYELAMIARDTPRFNYTSELDYLESQLKGIGEAGRTSNTINYYTPLQYTRLQLLRGNIGQDEYDAQLSKWRNSDYRQEYMDLVWQTPLRQSYNLSVNSSSKRQSTFASINLIDNGQQIKYNSNNQIKAYIKSIQKINDWFSFDIGSDIQYSRTENVQSVYSSITSLEPYTNILDESGNRVYRDYVDIIGMQGSLHINPKVLDEIEGLPQFESYKFNILDELNDNLINQNYYSVRSFVKLNFDILKNLKFSTGFDYELARNRKEEFRSKDSYFYRFMRNKFANNSPINSVFPEGGRFSMVETSRDSWVWRNQVDYNKQIGDDHSFNVTGGIELKENSVGIPINALYYGYDPVALTYTILNNYDIHTVGYQQSYIYNNNTGKPGAVLDGNNIKIADSEMKPGLGSVINRYVGMYAVGGYAYKEKYGISGSIRVDQTNLFGTDPKYRYRPLWSAGLKWNMGKEEFMSSVNWVDFLDLRLSYGLTGNVDQSTTPFLVASLSNQSTYTSEAIPYANISTAPNPMLRWEKTSSYNFGTDYSFFRGLLNGKLDLYYKNSEDLLGSREVHFTSGYTTQRVNSGAMTNRGFELIVTSPWLKKKDFTMTSSLMLSYNKNKVTKAYYNPTQASHLAISSYLVDGKPYDALYAYEYGGLTSGGTDYQNGVPIIYRADGTTMHHFQEDGTLLLDASSSMRPEDVKYMGSRTPLYNASFTQTINYKGFELSALFLYYGGHKMYAPSFGFNSTDGNSDWVSKSWTPNNTNTDIPKSKMYYDPKISVVNLGSLEGMYIRSTANVVKGDFIRLRNIALSYTLPNSMARNLKLSRLKIAGQINNPWIWSAAGRKYDSEVQTSQSNTASLKDWGIPTPTTYLLKLDVTF